MSSPSIYKLIRSPNYSTFSNSFLQKKEVSSEIHNFSDYLSKNAQPIQNFTYLKSINKTEKTEKALSPRKDRITCFEGKETKIRTKKIR
jgi:hypothetical protein